VVLDRRHQEGHVTTAHAPQEGGFARGWRNFRRWQQARPFWGGLLLLLSGLELLLSGNMNLGALQVHVGETGFLSYVIPAMLILCGAMTWATPNLRLFYGVIGALVAVYSLIGLNFGGFLIGLLLGIFGGALAIAWTPVVVAVEESAAEESVAGEPDAPEADAPEAETADPEYAPDAADTVVIPVVRPDDETDEASPAWFLEEHGPGDRDGVPPAQPAHLHEEAPYRSGYENGNENGYDSDNDSGDQPERRWWDQPQPGAHRDDQDPPPATGGPGGHRARIFAITFVPLTLAAALLTAAPHPRPAYAAPTPTPTPCPFASGSAGAKHNQPASSGKPAPNQPRANQPAPNQPAPGSGPGAAPTGSATPAPTGTSGSDGTGNPIVDGWNDFVDGIGRLFGGGKEEATPAPSASAAPSAVPSAGPGATTPGKPPAPGTAPSGGPAGKPSTSAQPCAPGDIRSAAVQAGQPAVSTVGAVLTSATVTMVNSKYEGVVDLPTKTGTIKALKFTMTRSVAEPFQLRTPETNGKTTSITSSALTTDGNVRFYATKFTGTLKKIGLGPIPIPIPIEIPLTFTPESPPPLPPLTISELVFANATIDLAYVRCDVLTAPAMHINEV